MTAGSVAVSVLAIGVLAQAPGPATTAVPEPARNVRFPAVSPADLREWLTYLSSDELQGRQVFTEGYGIAAQYVAERLRDFGVAPIGDRGTYFQIVRLNSYSVTRHSTVTVEAGGQRRMFRDGEHFRLPAAAGGRQTLVLDEPELVRAVAQGPVELRAAGTGSRPGARATLSYRPGAAGAQAVRTTNNEIPPTTRRIDAVVPPTLTVDDEFVTALLADASGAPAVRGLLGRGEPVAVKLSGVKVTIDVDNTYEVLRTQLSRNVVGRVEGTDARLKETYVLFGAHLDHVGYASSTREPPGRANAPVAADRIWNGADDDGTGTTAVMAIAKAFATGPKPKRSVVFIWHTGEEANLYGSGYNADFPVVPVEKMICQLNIDMIGRNRNDDPRQANTVFVIGADRISTDLHNLIVRTNALLAPPLTLDYEYNDSADPNSFYTRSDHYSYASKGVPIAFFFTGEHPDYHANTDTVDKILFDKQARITQLVYQVGYAVADSAAELRRDNRGVRAGKGWSGPLR